MIPIGSIEKAYVYKKKKIASYLRDVNIQKYNYILYYCQLGQ